MKQRHWTAWVARFVFQSSYRAAYSSMTRHSVSATAIWVWFKFISTGMRRIGFINNSISNKRQFKFRRLLFIIIATSHREQQQNKANLQKCVLFTFVIASKCNSLTVESVSNFVATQRCWLLVNHKQNNVHNIVHIDDIVRAKMYDELIL